MKGLVFTFAVILMFSATGLAQSEDPRYEVSGGYSLFVEDGDSWHGYTGAFAGSLNNWFSLVGEGSQQFRTEDATGVEAKANIFSYRFGPRFTARAGRVRPFGQILLGGARVTGTAETVILRQPVSVSASANSFSASAGGGLDIPITRHFTIRAGQVDFNYYHGGEIFDVPIDFHGVKFTTGAVFRF